MHKIHTVFLIGRMFALITVGIDYTWKGNGVLVGVLLAMVLYIIGVTIAQYYASK